MNIFKKILSVQAPRGRFSKSHGYFDLDEDSGYEGPFESVSAMIQAGIMRGDGYGAFRPHDWLTFAEMATALCRLRGIPEGEIRRRPGDRHWGSRACARIYAIRCMDDGHEEADPVNWKTAADYIRAVVPGASSSVDRYRAGLDRNITRAEFCELVIRAGVRPRRRGRGR